eukprot:3114474-Alexandrium_andersonii.AAC.1
MLSRAARLAALAQHVAVWRTLPWIILVERCAAFGEDCVGLSAQAARGAQGPRRSKQLRRQPWPQSNPRGAPARRAFGSQPGGWGDIGNNMFFV